MNGPVTEEGRLLDCILAHGLSRPHDTALQCGPVRLDWAGLRERVLSFAGAVSANGDRKPGRVALLGNTSADMVVAYLGTIAAGGSAVPLPLSAHADAIAGMLEDCAPEIVFADAESRDLLRNIEPSRIVLVGSRGPGSFASFCENTATLAAPALPAPEAEFNIIYSSGTTGRAKGIVHSHAMRYRQAARSLFGIGPSSTMLLATPLYSNTTLMPLLATLFHGGRVILMSKFDAEAYLDLAEREGATHTMLVPVQYQRILAAKSFPRRDLSSFKVKQCTGAPLAPMLKREIAQKWPGRFLEVYGLTEGGCTCILDVSAFPDKAHTVGRPAAGNDIRIIDEKGAFVPAGERGEIVGRSATMMSGYHRNEEANAAFYWRDAEGVLYHRTGDIGMFDDDGFLLLVDRKKDLIISGGFNIYASDLEEKLLEHPAVAEAAVIAMPSEKWGETPLGLVVQKEGAKIDTSELLAWVNARLGKTQRLAAVEIRAELPRSNVGKILKQELRKPYWEGRK